MNVAGIQQVRSGAGRKSARGHRCVGVLAVLLLAGCTTVPEEPEVPRIVWPEPPATARIEFVRTITSEKDINQETTFSENLVNILAGVKPPPTRIVQPMGLAVSDDGSRLYVSNFSPGTVFGFDFDGRRFHKIESLGYPSGLALDSSGNLYVVEQYRRRVTIFNPSGTKIGAIVHPDLVRPNGIAIDRKRGRIYVTDTGRNNRGEDKQGHTVRVFNMTGEPIGTLGRGRGYGPGYFLFPTFIEVDRQGNVYVADTVNARIQVFDPDGNYVRSIGQRGNAWGMFDKPKGVAVDSFGNVYVADSGWSNVQIFNQKGQILMFFGGRGPIAGLLINPTAVEIDANNRIYVADFMNHRINVYQLVNTTSDDSFRVPPSQQQGAPSTG